MTGQDDGPAAGPAWRAATAAAVTAASVAAPPSSSHQWAAAMAPAASTARAATVEATPPASTAHRPAVPLAGSRRRYCPACQAAAAAGPAGSSLARPVEANTVAATARNGSRAPASASSWRCATTRPATKTISAAAAAPSQGSRSPYASAARTSAQTAGTRSAISAAAPPVTAHAHRRASRRRITAPCRAIFGARPVCEPGASAAILPFSHPPRASPRAAIGQNSRNAASLPKISP